MGLKFARTATAAAAAATLLVVGGLASPAFALTSPGISGTIIQASGGSAATNVCAEIYVASDTYNPVGSGCSDTTGYYSVTGLSAGQYLVQFIDGDTVRHDVPQWYNNKPDSASGNFVTVTAGAITGNVNAVMAAGGAISGTITDASNKPIANECVTVYDAANGNPAGAVANAVANAVTDQSCTDSSGVYTTGGLAAGSYQVAFNTDTYGNTFDSNYVPQWYNKQTDQANAVSVPVAAGAPTPGIDTALQLGVAVSGTVDDTAGAVDSAQVQFLDSVSGRYVGFASTSPTGTYTTSVAPGAYKVEFQAPYGSADATQWYNNKPDQSTADTLTVTAGTPVTGLNAHLSLGGSITGTVTTAGAGVEGIYVDACPTAGGQCVVAPSTAADGTYSLTGVWPGDYYVTFQGGGYYDSAGTLASTAAYLSQNYPNIIATGGAARGTVVTVTAGTATPNINDTAVLGSTFSGTITDAVTHLPLSNICVAAVPMNQANGYYSVSRYCTDSLGKYTTGGVPTGSYQLDFTNYQGRYIEQWYDNQSAQSTATTLSVTQPTDKSGVDAAMQLGGNVSGTVTAATGGAALSGVCVTLFPAATAAAGTGGLYGGCTDSSGKFSSPSVAAGNYVVQFVDNTGSYTSQYFKGATTEATATTVSVTQGNTASGINAALAGQSVPGAPTGVSATAGDGAATVGFTAPASDGGSSITGYMITSSPACTGCTGLTTASTSATVRGLTNGTAYTFTVTATNSTGNGQASAASNSVTPTASTGGTTVPGAPTNVSATVDVSTVAVSYSAPAVDGGSSITGYTITSSPACTGCTGLSATKTSSAVTGLTNGTAYTFKVTATNSKGTGLASVASNAVTPTAAAVSPVSATSTDSAKPATVSNNGTTATASGGTGTVTVSQYPSNPTAAATYPSNGSFLDVSVSKASTFQKVVIKDCNLSGGTSLQWWNPKAGTGGAWQAVVGDPADTSGLPGCLAETFDASSSPTVAELGGTIFGVALPAAGGGGGGGGVSVPGAPTGVHATAGDAQATVSFTAPAADGGAPVTGYMITPNPACSACTGLSTAGTSATVKGLTNGTAYTFTVSASNSAGAGPGSAPSAAITPTAPVITVDRIAGIDRYATAIAASTKGYPTQGSAGAVVLARGDLYPDALVGAPLAKAHNAPVLLTTGTTLPAAVKTEIQRAVPAGGTVYLLGGSDAIPAGVEAQIKNLGFTPVRYAGADRFATALAVAHALGDPSTVLLATGTNFPDALAAGPAAAHLGGAILLTNGTAMATGDSTYLAAHPGQVYAIGGPAAAARPSATAIVGGDRYATAASVATRFFTAPTTVGVATGTDFPDALTGSALLAGKDAPVLLATATSLPPSSSSYLTSVKSSVKTAYIFGGTTALQPAVATAVATALS